MLQLQRTDIVTAYWQRQNLHVLTTQGGMVFKSRPEQWHMTQALQSVGIKVASPKLSREQRWLKDAHQLLNIMYFAKMLTTPYFELKTLHLDRDAEYNVKTRTVSFDKHVWRRGFDKTPRAASDLLLHECIHQFLAEGGWQPTKGIDPHSEQCFIDVCRILTPALGLPAKQKFALSELQGFPASITHESYYREHAKRKPLYDWTA